MTAPCRIRKNGFTLIEITIATAIVMVIFSVVYGTFFATTRSAQRCNDKITSSQQACSLLTRMTRQIRCVYPGPCQTEPADYEKTNDAKIVLSDPKNNPASFVGNTGDKGGIILSMITTAGILRDKLTPNGPFTAIYKYEPDTGVLFYAQSRYMPEATAGNDNWTVFAENIESMELSFHDGLRRLDRWDSRTENSLPRTVEIRITVRDDQSGSTKFSTTAYLHCQ